MPELLLPAFIEHVPGEFKPAEECTVAELRAALKVTDSREVAAGIRKWIEVRSK